MISEIVLPVAGDRAVHGNASLQPRYFERVLGLAIERGAGIAFAHAHPLGRGSQGLSADDRDTESTLAPRAFGATGRPLVGLTMAGDGFVAARFWERVARRDYALRDCHSVRVAGERLRLFFNERLVPSPQQRITQTRSIAAWGQEAQSLLSRLRLGVVGLGNVGSIVAEILARTGIGDVILLDYDSIEMLNLDRTLNATRLDVLLGRSKVEIAARAFRRASPLSTQRVTAVEASVVEDQGFRAALDCDVLFSCVDRPWGRAALNLIAYAHGIPVIDGGIVVRTIAAAGCEARVGSPYRRARAALP